MTKYIKTRTTEFEQFDETEWNRIYLDCSDPDEWEIKASKLGVDRYHGYFIIPTKEGDMRIHDGDWIATGVNGEHWPVKDEIFQKTYKRLPRITDRVAQIIESAKKSNESLADVISAADIALTYTTIPIAERKDKSWILNHSAEFARAWLDDFEVADD